MGDCTYAKNADRHHMYDRANGNGRTALRMYHEQSMMPDHRIFSDYIVNFVKHLCSTSPDMMLVDEELYAVQAWKKAP
ncbi:hypothetical protein TNCV_3014911 [Trichonephila clavipes]|nr:hypothetical protein TNCV_3014911 [Trichonephila clavipes]